MKMQITIDELNTVLESREFESTFKERNERPMFTFKEGFIIRDGDPFARYNLTKQGNNFKISIYGTELSLFTEIYRNIILVVKNDKRFPISLDFNSGSKDIILAAKPI